MRTPYDTAARIQQRQVDEMRVAINVEMTQLMAVETSQRSMEAALAREAALAAEDPMMSSFAYLSRMTAERARLDHSRQAISGRLDRLRGEAVAAYGSLRAIEGAAESFREEEERAASGTEQSRIDDISNAAFLAARRRATASRSRAG